MWFCLYQYDPAGNLIDDGVTSYTYDAASRLTSLTNADTGMTASYAYNGLGDRMRQTVNGVQTDYLLDLNRSLTQVLGEFAPGDDTWYLLGLDVIGQQQSCGWGYFGYDGLGSGRQMTDSAGALAYMANYDPYGLPLELGGDLTTALGFTGEYTDPTGLVYLRARYMSPTMGMFLSKDPFEGVMQRVMSRNGYSYVHGNPVNWTDPSGKLLPLLVLGAAVIGGGIASLAGATLLVTAGAALGAAAIAWITYQAFNNQAIVEFCQEAGQRIQDIFTPPQGLEYDPRLDQTESLPLSIPPPWTEVIPDGSEVPSLTEHLPLSTPVLGGEHVPLSTPIPGSSILAATNAERLSERLQQEGIEVFSDADAVAYLDWASQVQGSRVNASTLDENTIFIRPEYLNNLAILLEEYFHAQQHAQGLTSTDARTRYGLEIEAKQNVISVASSWGITSDQIEQLRREIEYYQNLLNSLAE